MALLSDMELTRPPHMRYRLRPESRCTKEMLNDVYVRLERVHHH